MNHCNRRIIMNRGLTASSDESSGLAVRGKNDSALLESIDSRKMVRNLSAAQKYMENDFFVTYTCNQKEYFGTKPIKEYIDYNEWQDHYYCFKDLTPSEVEEIHSAVMQVSAYLLLRTWQEVCKLFLDYLKNSPKIPFRKVVSLFARHEYQKDAGNLPHTHAMLKVNWDKMTEEEKEFVNDLI